MTLTDRASEAPDLAVIYSTLSAWALLLACFPPKAMHSVVLGPVIILLDVVTLAGALIALTGVLRRDNLVLEQLGVRLAIAGPLGYALLELVLAVVGALQGNTDRFALVAYALLPALYLNKRRRFLAFRAALIATAPVAEEAPR